MEYGIVALTDVGHAGQSEKYQYRAEQALHSDDDSSTGIIISYIQRKGITSFLYNFLCY